MNDSAFRALMFGSAQDALLGPVAERYGDRANWFRRDDIHRDTEN